MKRNFKICKTCSAFINTGCENNPNSLCKMFNMSSDGPKLTSGIFEQKPIPEKCLRKLEYIVINQEKS